MRSAGAASMECAALIALIRSASSAVESGGSAVESGASSPPAFDEMPARLALSRSRRCVSSACYVSWMKDLPMRSW